MAEQMSHWPCIPADAGVEQATSKNQNIHDVSKKKKGCVRSFSMNVHSKFSKQGRDRSDSVSCRENDAGDTAIMKYTKIAHDVITFLSSESETTDHYGDTRVTVIDLPSQCYQNHTENHEKGKARNMCISVHQRFAETGNETQSSESNTQSEFSFSSPRSTEETKAYSETEFCGRNIASDNSTEYLTETFSTSSLGDVNHEHTAGIQYQQEMSAYVAADTEPSILSSDGDTASDHSRRKCQMPINTEQLAESPSTESLVNVVGTSSDMVVTADETETTSSGDNTDFSAEEQPTSRSYSPEEDLDTLNEIIQAKKKLKSHRRSRDYLDSTANSRFNLKLDKKEQLGYDTQGNQVLMGINVPSSITSLSEAKKSQKFKTDLTLFVDTIIQRSSYDQIPPPPTTLLPPRPPPLPNNAVLLKDTWKLNSILLAKEKLRPSHHLNKYSGVKDLNKNIEQQISPDMISDTFQSASPAMSPLNQNGDIEHTPLATKNKFEEENNNPFCRETNENTEIPHSWYDSNFQAGDIARSALQKDTDTIFSPRVRTNLMDEDDAFQRQIDDLFDAIIRNTKKIDGKKDLIPHFTKNGRHLYELYKHDRFTDLIVVIGKHTFNVHSAVLAQHSEHIANMIQEKLPVERVTLDTGVTPGTFKVALQYMYTGELDINNDNLAELFECATILQLPDIVVQCNKIFDQKSPEELLQVIQMAVKADVKVATLEKQFAVLADNFSTIVNSPMFLNLEVATLCTLISRDDIRIQSELEVAQAVFTWMMHDDDRLQYSQKVIVNIRFLHMTSHEIIYIMSKYKGLMGNVVLMHSLLEWLWSRSSFENDTGCNYLEKGMPKPRIYLQGENLEETNSLASGSVRDTSQSSSQLDSDTNGTIRSPGMPTLLDKTSSTKLKQLNEVDTDSYLQDLIVSPSIFLIGRYCPESKTGFRGMAVERYDVFGDCWGHFSVIPAPRNKHGVVLLNEEIYVIGGSTSSTMSDQKPTNMVYKLNILTGLWETIQPMISARMNHVTTTMDNKIYAIGGQNKTDEILPTAEYYDPRIKLWMEAPAPRYSRIAAASALYNNKIYIAGGFGYETSKDRNGNWGKILDTVECYDLKGWTLVAPLPCPKINGRLAAVGESLYSFGGLGSSEEHSFAMSVDEYNSNQDSWTSVTMLMTPRCNPGVAVIGSKLYIVGGVGLEDVSGINIVERYDVETGVWTQMSPMLSPQADSQCVVYTNGTG